MDKKDLINNLKMANECLKVIDNDFGGIDNAIGDLPLNKKTLLILRYVSHGQLYISYIETFIKRALRD